MNTIGHQFLGFGGGSVRRKLGSVASGWAFAFTAGIAAEPKAAGLTFMRAACSANAARNSSHVWNRSFGSLASALRITASIPPGTAGLISDGATGSSFTILY